MTRLKKKRANASRSVNRKMEKDMMGAEPVWKETDNLRLQTLFALNYYNQLYSAGDSRKWIVEYMKKNKASAKDISLINSLSDNDIAMTVCSLCRIVSRGLPIQKSMMDWLEKRLEQYVELAKVKRQRKKETPTEDVPRRSPAEIVKENTQELIGEIEGILDDWQNHADFVLYDVLKTREVPYVTAKAIADYYMPLKEELELLLSKKDKELEEGYSHLKPAQRKKYLAFVSSLVSDSEKYMTGKKSVRKTRKKKTQKIENQIKRLNYKKEDNNLKVVSVDPISIVGATEFYIFNTRYNTVGYFVASDVNGLGVKGTTIQNFDETKSYKKRVKDPEKFLSELQSLPKTRARKMLENERRKPATISGRISEDILLIKGVK